MVCTKSLLWVMVGIFAASASAGAQNLVTNGSFEAPVLPAGTNQSVGGMPGWTSSPGQIELWNQFEGPAADGNQYVELDSDTCTTITQTIPTTDAKQYTISLAFSARGRVADNRIEVLWNGTVVGTASANGLGQTQPVWTNYAFAAGPGGAGSSTLQIRNVDACDSLGSLVDNVRVVAATLPPGQPVPTLRWIGLLLLVGGVAGVGVMARRRHRA